MAKRPGFETARVRLAQTAALALAAALAHAPARGQEPPAGWQACTAIADGQARLACFDKWSGIPGPAAAARAPEAPARFEAEVKSQAKADGGCHEQEHSTLSRFWELEKDSGCGVFGIRGYRPISLALIASDGTNGQPTSGNPLNNATTAQPYRTAETRIQLSVRTKLAQGLLTGDGPRRDSLWFGYTQQSYWQVFTPAISRPFRSTDHEPEFVYVYPSTTNLPGGWRLRYTGLGLVHQSNGQSLPLSRSWNRVYLMAGAEHGQDFMLQGRLWRRIPENATADDNPGISNYIGRAELAATWNVNASNTLALTLRHSLRSVDKGSARLEWLMPVDSKSPSPLGNLRFHVQLFNGYGDSLLDYNHRRTVLGMGLSLVDW
jgi:phospholipase A1/A2